MLLWSSNVCFDGSSITVLSISASNQESRTFFYLFMHGTTGMYFIFCDNIISLDLKNKVLENVNAFS